MTEKSMAMPTYDQVMWPALLALKEIGGSASIQDVVSHPCLPGRLAFVSHSD